MRVTKPPMARKGVAPEGACADVAVVQPPPSEEGALSDFCASAPRASPASAVPMVPPVAELPPLSEAPPESEEPPLPPVLPRIDEPPAADEPPLPVVPPEPDWPPEADDPPLPKVPPLPDDPPVAEEPPLAKAPPLPGLPPVADGPPLPPVPRELASVLADVSPASAQPKERSRLAVNIHRIAFVITELLGRVARLSKPGNRVQEV